jgi:ornithine--oxo-acid transaminase
MPAASENPKEQNNSQKFIDLENKYGANNYHPLDVVLTDGQGCWVTDADGNRYLDMLSAYSALNQGHRHPRIMSAAYEQLDRLTLTSRAFRNEKLPPFLEKVCQITGKEACLPMNTGAEAVETAIKLARKWAYTTQGIQKPEIIGCEGNFHGRTVTIVSMSTEPQYRLGFGPFTPGFATIPYGDVEALDDAITNETAAFLVEPIQGEAGVILPPPGYLRVVRDICDQHGILMIADEIQTGLGRTGKMFACDHEGVVPDIYILGKALSGGVSPVSAVTCNRNIMDVLKPGDHGSTFGGNPFGAAVGIAALDVIIEEHLPENAKAMGEYFMDGLKAMNSPHVNEIRGKGLLIAVEIKPESGKARTYCEKLQEAGILAKETHGTVVRFAPPLIITKDEIDWALNQISTVFK